MMWLPGYDAWKLATPPEYEWDDNEEEDEALEPDEPDYDAWEADGPREDE